MRDGHGLKGGLWLTPPFVISETIHGQGWALDKWAQPQPVVELGWGWAGLVALSSGAVLAWARHPLLGWVIPRESQIIHVEQLSRASQQIQSSTQPLHFIHIPSAALFPNVICSRPGKTPRAVTAQIPENLPWATFGWVPFLPQ